MSFNTQPAFVWTRGSGSWDEESDKHPAMKWMANYGKNVFDKKAFDMPASEKHDSDWTLHQSDGKVTHGAEDSWKAAEEMYAPFAAHLHRPNWMIVYETNDGFIMVGEATVFYNLHGEPSAGEKKVKDHSGTEWDGGADGAFRFEYVGKKTEEMKLKSTKVYNNPLPAVAVMIKRGLVKPQDLLS